MTKGLKSFVLIGIFGFSASTFALPKKLVLAVDGVPHHKMVKLQKKGRFRDFHPASRMISSFPSISGVAWSYIFDTTKPNGYMAFHFDRSQGKQVGSVLSDLHYDREFENRMHTSPKSSLYHLLSFVEKYGIYENELVHMRDFLLNQSKDEIHFAYIPGSDGIFHTEKHYEKVFDILEYHLHLLQLAYKRHPNNKDGKPLEILLISDHGNNSIPGKIADLDSPLKKIGFNITSKPQKLMDISLPRGGIVNFAPVYSDPSHRFTIAKTMAKTIGVDLAIAMHPKKQELWIYAKRNGVITTAKILNQSDKYAYQTLSGDPLEYAPLIDSLKNSGKLDAKGFAHKDDWFKVSTSHRNPNALHRLWRSLNDSVVYPADVLVALLDGYEVLDEQMGLAGKTSKRGGTHGGLSALASNGVVMSNTHQTFDTPADKMVSLFGSELPKYYSARRWWHLDGEKLTVSLPDKGGKFYIEIYDSQDKLLLQKKLVDSQKINLSSIVISGLLSQPGKWYNATVKLVKRSVKETLIDSGKVIDERTLLVNGKYSGLK